MNVHDSLTTMKNDGIGGGQKLEATEHSLLENKLYPTEPKRPCFPSLEIGVLRSNGIMQPDFPLNSRDAIPIETELFVGKLLFVLRPANPEADDPFWNERIFSRHKRRIVIQLQGKFKYKPKGDLYAGAEISDPMKLGFLAKGMCSLLLRFIEKFNQVVHYSFGDEKGKEKAHIVVPAASFFERLVVTPPSETPPPLGEPFNEPKDSIKARSAGRSVPNWNTTDTYSMSFHSMYIDLPTWKVVNVPFSGDISLKTFWANSMLRIVMYENTQSAKKSRHLREFNRYAVVIQMKHLGNVSESSGKNESESSSKTESCGDSDEDSSVLFANDFPIPQ